MSETATLPGQIASITTPINVVLLSLLLILAYIRFRPASTDTIPRIQDPVLFKTLSPPELLHYNGEDGKPIYFGVRGRIFDVSSGRNFYGPGGPYENFAGRDASRGLACGSFDEEMLTKDLQGPLDELKDLGDEEKEALHGWEMRFLEKYMVIGNLVSVAEKEKMDTVSDDGMTGEE